MIFDLPSTDRAGRLHESDDHALLEAIRPRSTKSGVSIVEGVQAAGCGG